MKAESRKYVRNVDHLGVKYRNKITASYNYFQKMNPIKGL